MYLIRHGNKAAADGGIGLDEKGKLRATKLVDLMRTLQIRCIVTSSPSVGTIRPQQTGEPTAFALDLPMLSCVDKKNAEGLRRVLYTAPQTNGVPVLVIWEHGCIQKVMRETFRVCGYKKFWDAENFATMLVLRKNKRGCWEWTCECENVLPGDAEACAAFCERNPDKFQRCS